MRRKGRGSMRKRKKLIMERRRRRILSGIVAFALVVSLGVGLFMNSGTTTQAAGKTVVDPDTTNVWSDIAASSTSTQNIGRIWTDKSVFDGNYTFSGSGQVDPVEKGDSDFLVSLSALSSTSNLKTTTTTSQPLDIVLVLDDSGSMAYGIDSDTPNQIVYTAVSADQVVESHGHTEQGWFGTSYIQDTRGGEYYVQNDRGGYDRVTEVTETHSDGWFQSYEEHIRWTVNGQTVDPETTQFYTRTEYDLSERRGALQYAVDNFIDQAAAMNAQIADENDKIRISIVVFDSNSSIENHLTVCEGANVGTLKNTVNNLEANGATNAGAGMTNANNELRTNSNREDTKQIVIFFTDGVPTTSSSFDTTVANNAVNQASQIKSRGGSVYSIGIFDGADPGQTEVGWNPNDTDRANVFMNAVSSNYPNATAWNNLGQRASGNPDFYKSADNAGSLNEVFQDIFDESTENAGSGSPIEEVTHEGELNPGTLTFTDDLGSYMEVSGNTMTVVYGDRKFTSTNKTTAGNVDTYHFEGTVAGNAIYKEANLADLTVTVTHSDDLATGDKVTVQIPASLIPMRNYDVDTNEKTMSVSAAYPIRLFYGVSVKEEVEKAIEQGSGDVYDAIKEDHLSEDGTIDFYSNAYAENAPNGLTEATFTPSEGNKFYYYTQDTPLYIDKECSSRATSSNIGSLDRVYYADTYWTTENGTTSETTEGMVVVRGGIEFGKIQYDQQGRAYMPAHTQRTDRPNTLITAKEDFEGGNATGTALNVLVPGWNDNGIVSQALGNNGKISYPAPGELEIKKNVDWGNASDDTKEKQNSFKFTVNFNDDETLEGDFAYDVYESGEEPVSNGKVSDGGTITLKDGQRAVIKGLPSDTTFTVTETEANKNGFATTDIVTADPNNDTTDGIANGTIKGGSQQSVSFQNNYNADEPLEYNISDDLNVEKVLEGRDWRDDDEFTFNVQALDGYAPDVTEVTINKNTTDHKASFGTITFDKDGEFRYVVREDNDVDSPIAGIDYSNATYRLTVKVVDAGNGKLKIESTKLEMFQDDSGAVKNPAVAVEGTTATFTNNYLSDKGTINIDGKKAYDDTTGGNQIGPNKFQFQMEALGGYVTDGGSRDNLTVSADATPKPTEDTEGNVTTIGNVGYEFHMPTITFDGNDVGNTYVYKITEVQGNEAGMTYDGNSYEVEVKVTEVPDPEAGEDLVQIQATANKTPEELTFTNKYEPTAAKLEGDNAIHGTKTLEGRQMKEGETFFFQLSALNDNAKTVLSAPETVTVTDQNSMDFTFADMTFTKVGTYTFQVNEVADDNGTETTNANGMTFDTNIATVTVTVTDGNDSDDPADHGKLLASVSYSNDKHSNVTDHAQFTNVYKANMNYGAGGAGGIAVTKTMVDRTMDAGDYNFTLTGTGPDGEITETFENTAAAANRTVTMKQLQNLTFDEQDAEKTFTFTVDEADPTDENRLPGVEYDQSQYRVNITVHDNHDGYMYTETTVTKIKNADGTEANEIVVDKLNSSTAQGEVPTFGFKNVYKPTEASLDGDTALQVTKKVTGADSPDGVNYSFTLTAQDTAEGSVANIGGLTDGELTVSTSGVISADSEQTVPFGTLTFSEPGTYTFTVQEDQPAADDGWTFDDTDGNGVTDEHTVKVEVSYLNENNEYDGELHIKSVTPQGPTVITNSYKADPVIVGGEDAEQRITVQKSVTGADSTAEFKFEIEPVIDDEHTQQWWKERVKGVDGFSPELTISGVTQEQPVTEAFDGIQFNAVGEYKFTVTEVGAAEFNAGSDRKGWTYDEHTAVVTVNVTDEGNDGQLDAEVVYDNTRATTDTDKSAQAAAFTNKYVPAEVTTGIQVTKKVTGHDAIEAFTFSLTLKDGQNGDAVYEGAGENKTKFDGMEVTSAGDIKAEATDTKTFDDITFTEKGDYTFVIDETTEKTDEGWTYDTTTKEVTVHVEDNGEGNLYIGSIDNNTPEFVNEYHAGADYNAQGAGGLDITKKLNNRNMTADQFTFTIEATGDNAAEKLGIKDGTATTVKNAAGNAGEAVSVVGNPFETMSFDETDDGVTYTYTIKEEGTSGEDDYAGYTLDDTTYTVSITATDDGDGTMTVKTVVNDGVTDKEYTDERATVAFENTYKAGDVTVGAEGAAQIKANKTLKNDNIANYAGKFNFQVTSGNVVVAKGTNDANGNITFADITYTTENLAAAATVDGSDTVGKADLDTSGDKDVYTFTYSVSEVTDSLPDGVTYNSGDTNVTVKVTDDRHGKLDVKVGYADGASSVEFVNTYGKDGKAELNLKGNKKIVPGKGLTEAPALVDDTYTFEITGNDAADGTPAPMPAETTATNKSGAVEFGTITFTMEKVFGTTPTTQDVTVEEEQTTEETTVEGETTTAEGEAEAVAGEEAAVTEGETVTAGVTNADEGIELQTAGREKTFTYTIKEIAGNVPGVDNDTTVKTVTVTVTDKGDGTIDVAKTEAEGHDEGNDFTFTNVYNVDPKDSSLTGDGGFKITKTLTGRDMAAGEFAFRLKEQNSDWWTAPTNPAAADGEAAEITFGDVHFTKPGTYTYTLEEVQGNLAGVEYDSNKYTVIATVTDKDAEGNYTGKLEVTWEIPGATGKTVAFKNTYTADPTSVSLGAGKLIKGRDLKAGEFSFLLSDADGKEIDTAKNEENGAVTFKTITFDKAGTYRYEIREVLPEDDDSKTDGIQSSNVTYDENIYHVTVDVKDNTEKGCLEATVTYEDSDGAPVFVNTYTEPADDGDDVGIFGVKTGDPAETAILLTIMGVALAVIVAMSMILIRRRRR